MLSKFEKLNAFCRFREYIFAVLGYVTYHICDYYALRAKKHTHLPSTADRAPKTKVTSIKWKIAFQKY